MPKLDLKKELKNLYTAKADAPVLIKVPKMNYLAIDGKGDPNTSQEFKDAVETLYPVAYKLKFTCKKELNKDYTVMPLEGLWWMEDMTKFTVNNKKDWLWTMLIMQPDFITKEMYQKALIEVKSKKQLVAINKIKFITLNEGSSAQILHIGPFSAEKPTIKKLHTFIKEKGHGFNDNKQKHHEIYLSDMRKTAPEKLKTILRQPVV